MVAGIGLALLVLAASLVGSLLRLRERIFSQIANRDGETLDAVAAVQFADDKANDESVTTLKDPSEQINLALKISNRLPSVIGVRLFSAGGQFVIAFPAYITEAALSADDLTHLRALRPISHFVASAKLKEQDLLAETDNAAVPLLVVNIPLREEGAQHLEGIAQFLVHGSSIAQEYSELDKHLAAQGALAFSVSGAIVSAGILLAFRRVQRANARLAERTSNLLRANRELALAAKTSAIGAVTSHLIHGLKNPLSGLRSFVQDRALGLELADGTDWQLAVASTQRMQSLIDRVVRVLQEQQTVAEYEISFAELVEMLDAKFRPVAQSADIRYASSLSVAGALSNRDADLILLILENLLQNAIEATPAGKEVKVRVLKEGTQVFVEVEDQGPGLRAEAAERLFMPCASNKKGGNGIGLAISHQLAMHLGGRLELKQSCANGCCFRLILPGQDATSAGKPGDTGKKTDLRTTGAPAH